MHKNKRGAGACLGAALCIASMCLALTGCLSTGTDYTVEGATGEESRVTDEPFVPAFATDAAAEEEPGSTSEPAVATEESGEGNTDAQAAESHYRTLVSDTNLCQKPKGKVISVVPAGSRVELLSDVENGWYQVRYRSVSGYMQEGFFKEDLERLEAQRKAEEAEQRRKQQEEEEKKKKEEEEKKKKEEEEKKKKEKEEAKKKAEEEKKKKEEEKKKKAEEEKKKKEEEEARKKEEEERKRKEQEERERAMAAGEVTRTLETTVNLRDPDDTDVLLGIVPAGDTVTVYEALDDDWYLVESRGVRGVIKGGYFKEGDP